jgi:hypothetical protein
MQTLEEAQSGTQNPIVDTCVLLLKSLKIHNIAKGMVPPPNLKHIGEIP